MQGCNIESQNDFNCLKNVINHDRSNQTIVEKLPLKHWKFHEISNTSVSYTK